MKLPASLSGKKKSAGKRPIGEHSGGMSSPPSKRSRPSSQGRIAEHTEAPTSARRVVPPPPVEFPALFSAPSQDEVLLPDTQIYNKGFIMPDVPEGMIPRMQSLPARFSLAFQAIYDTFFDKDWEAVEGLDISSCQNELLWT